MTCKDLDEYFEKTFHDYKNYKDICYPPLNSQIAVIMLCNHFLGPNWSCNNNLSKDQLNTEIVYEILSRYPNPNELRNLLLNENNEKKNIKKRIVYFFKNRKGN